MWRDEEGSSWVLKDVVVCMKGERKMDQAEEWRLQSQAGVEVRTGCCRDEEPVGPRRNC